jgi:selenide,water dikinase
VLHAILAGSQEKVTEAGGLTVGGHTIADSPPKFGLAVTGLVHPDRVMTNSLGKPGEVLILTKPLGTGALVAGQRLWEAAPDDYQRALATMKLLNRRAAEVAERYGVRCATDITGFGLLGHLLHIARASRVTAIIDAASLPVLPGALPLLRQGCIPGAAFRNQTYVERETSFSPDLPYERKMLCLDPQTSGGLLFSISADVAPACLSDLHRAGCPDAAVVGCLIPRGASLLEVA